MNILWVPRSVWGSSASTEEFIADRVTDAADKKTEIQVHQTAAVDTDDTTPNRWDYAEAVAYMRKLQWSRPDLGPLPYSENLAVSEDLDTVWVFEGRGILKRGAHTGGHNVAGVGWGILGNFDRYDIGAARAVVGAIQVRARQYRQTVTPRLGDVKNPKGWDAWGHRDSSSKSCPGNYLYPLLANFNLEDEMTPEDFERIRAIVREEIRTQLMMDTASGPAHVPGEPNRPLSYLMVNSTLHAKSNGRKIFQTIDEIHDLAETTAGSVADEIGRRLGESASEGE